MYTTPYETDPVYIPNLAMSNKSDEIIHEGKPYAAKFNQ